MRACTSCGAEIGDDAAFCSSCGKAQASSDRPRPSRRTLLTAGIGVLGVLALAGVAAFLLFPRSAEGVLVSLTTGQPIPGAAIRCSSGVVRTDGSGRFALPDLRLGRHPVTVTATGFPPFDVEVNVSPLGAEENRIPLPDAAVTVRLEEKAVQPQDLAGAKVLVGRRTASRAADGTYELKGLQRGTVTIAVAAPGHEPTRTTVDLGTGGNQVTVRVRLTPEETYTRYFNAYKSGKWQAAYAYLHRDVAKRYPLATFTADMKDWGTPQSITMNRTRMLGSWTSVKTGAAYKNVAEVNRTLVTVKAGGRFVSSLPQHWVDVDGVWLRVDY